MLAEDLALGVRGDDRAPAEIAFATVRLLESFVHVKRITGEEPDPDRARRILHGLLR